MPFMPVSNETKERAVQFVESIDRMADMIKYYKTKFVGVDKKTKKLIDEMMDDFDAIIGKVPEMNRSGDYIKNKNECCLEGCDGEGLCYREERDEWYCTDCYVEHIDADYEEPTLGIKETKVYMDAYRQSLCDVKEFVVEKKVKRVLPALTKADIYEKNGKPHCKCPLCDCEMTVRHYIDNHPKILKCTHIKQVRVSDVKKALETPAPVVAAAKKERKKPVKKIVKKEKTPEPIEESIVDDEDRCVCGVCTTEYEPTVDSYQSNHHPYFVCQTCLPAYRTETEPNPVPAPAVEEPKKTVKRTIKINKDKKKLILVD
tara:strand:+ start:43 stop:990 length:948 start_codon:yes stop_codon:yes gene_type:complete